MLFDEWMSINVQVGSPMKTGRDLLERVKANPEALPFGISTSRSGGNFTTLMTCLRAGGIDIKRGKTVIFQGGGATTQALLGGHVEVINTGPGNMVEFLRVGKLSTLATSGPKRLWGPFRLRADLARAGCGGRCRKLARHPGPEGHDARGDRSPLRYHR